MLKWPVREGLLKYIELLKDDAREQFNLGQILFGLGALEKPPRTPSILRDG